MKNFESKAANALYDIYTSNDKQNEAYVLLQLSGLTDNEIITLINNRKLIEQFNMGSINITTLLRSVE